jgi:Tol biopolymer transport system component/DNA-binding winged helix-turn-helix (wHTH) protein
MSNGTIKADSSRQDDQTRPFQIGEWLVSPEVNALVRDGVEQRIEPKVMKVLLTLAAEPNHVVSKEKLIATVWPDAFVSDDVLTRCISILRRITGDDAHAPRYIQTVPKVGYRLIALVEEADATPPNPMVSEQLPASILPVESREAGAPVAEGAIQKRYLLRSGIALFCLGLLAVFIFFRLQQSKRVGVQALPHSFRTLQFTFAEGEQVQPAFSPDGTRMAFVQIPEEEGLRRIYVQGIGRDLRYALTPELAPNQIGDEFSPAWSPDGKRIAYLALTKDGPSLFLASTASNPADRPPVQRLRLLQEPSHWEQGALSWSPDGRYLIYPDHIGSSPNSSILELELKTGRVRRVTTPPAGWEGDLTPAYSPDGKRIGFTRASETAVRDLYWITVADGRLHQLTHDHMSIDSLAWAADGKSILFSSDRGGKFALWSIGLEAKEPERLPVGTEDAVEPSVDPRKKQLAYVQGSAIWSIRRVRRGPASPEPILSSTQQDSAPSLSPNGKRFAFQCRRSGSQQIWVSTIDGKAVRQLTFMSGALSGSPSWSNDGNSILFDSRPDGHSHIFVIAAAGGTLRQLTFGAANDIVPRWSRDNRTVYFRSNRGGQWQLWKVDVSGSDLQPVTLGDGIEPQESADGRWLYYTRGDADGIWRSTNLQREQAGESGTREQIQDQPVFDQPSANYWGYWQLTAAGIFYLDLKHGPPAIRLLDLTTNRRTTFAILRQAPPIYAGLSVADDGATVLVTEKREAGRHITLVETN